MTDVKSTKTTTEGFSHDEVEWEDLILGAMEEGLGFGGGDTIEEATRRPGNCVKSLERGPTGGPRYHGRLLKYGDTCVVTAHQHDPVFVWKGSREHYHEVWTVD